MTEDVDRSRFAHLPEPVRPEDVVLTVDTRQQPVDDGLDERDRLLRMAGGGG